MVPPIPLDEIRISFARSSGPGGQNVNKVNSKAVLRWAVLTSPSLAEDLRQRLVHCCGRRITRAGELILVSQRFRDAGRNVADCLDKLRAILAQAAQRPVARRPTRPTAGSRRRRQVQKQSRAAKKQGRHFRPEE